MSLSEHLIAEMGFWRKLERKLDRAADKVADKMNLDFSTYSYSQEVENMDEFQLTSIHKSLQQKLLGNKSATTTALAASFVHPLSLGAAALSGRQLYVNQQKREIVERRLEEKGWNGHDLRFKDVLIGVGPGAVAGAFAPGLDHVAHHVAGQITASAVHHGATEGIVTMAASHGAGEGIQYGARKLLTTPARLDDRDSGYEEVAYIPKPSYTSSSAYEFSSPVSSLKQANNYTKGEKKSNISPAVFPQSLLQKSTSSSRSWSLFTQSMERLWALGTMIIPVYNLFRLVSGQQDAVLEISDTIWYSNLALLIVYSYNKNIKYGSLRIFEFVTSLPRAAWQMVMRCAMLVFNLTVVYPWRFLLHVAQRLWLFARRIWTTFVRLLGFAFNMTVVCPGRFLFNLTKRLLVLTRIVLVALLKLVLVLLLASLVVVPIMVIPYTNV